MSNEFDNLLCKKDCKQIEVYLLTQSLSIMIHIGFFLAILIKSKVTGKKIGLFIAFIIILIVLTIAFYYLIKYLCKNNYHSIAWVFALAPYYTAPFTTYSNVSNIINNINNID